MSVLTGLGDRSIGSAQPDRTRRLVLLGLLLLNLLMVTVCISLLLSSWRGDIAEAQAETLHDARLTEQVVSGMFDKVAIALGAVGVQVERQLDSPVPDWSMLWSIVDAQSVQVPEIQRIGVFDASGAQRCGLPAERCQRLNIADRAYFQRLREHPEDAIKVHGPFDNGADGYPALMLARAIRAKDGRFAGVAVAVLPLGRLTPLVVTPWMGAGGSVSLRTAALDLVVRHPELAGPGAAEASRKVSETLRAAVAKVPEEGVYRAVTANDGVDRVTAYRRLAKHPMYVLVGRSTGDFLAGWHSQVAWTVVFLLLFATVSGLLARATSISLRRHAQALRLYDEAPCGYHMLDTNGTYVSINATELGWLGFAREDVVGKMKPTDFFTDEGRATFAANFPRLARASRLEGLDLELVGRNGKVRRVLVNATAVYDAKGVFVNSNSVMHDITALHDARMRLQALAQQQGAMLDNELVGIVRLVNRRAVWKNQAMDRIFGYAGAEWQDMPSRTLYPDDETHRRIGDECQVAWQDGRTYRSQLQMIRKDGSKVWIDASGVMLSQSTGEVMMLLADITPLKAAEEARVRAAALEAQNFQLRETNRLKSELLSNMSHELRTPLNAILGFGGILMSGSVKPDSPKYATYIARIVDSGKHLLGLIEQVLEYAAVESGRMAFVPERVDVPRALHEAVEMLQVDSSARRVSIHIDVDEGLDTVLTDAMRLRQMLLALVGNAVKFSHEGGRVQVDASSLDPVYWKIVVTDHGIGIDEASLPRLFSPFMQLSTGNAKAYAGTGIGLALVRLVALAQGGRIEVHSRPGLGSTFTLILPRVLGSSAQFT
ncbi:MAG: PAS domain S-box protein [Burkholderiaceae bacterium]|nr:PAS domain S-box protein [Burkholderiaceae bacterium]